MRQFVLLLISLPTFIFAWPIEQEPFPVRVWRSDPMVPWYLPKEVPGNLQFLQGTFQIHDKILRKIKQKLNIQVQLRSVDVGNPILRTIADSDSNNWLGLTSGNSASGNFEWRRRFNDDDGSKRRGGLDSLGRGNILKKSIYY